MRGRWAGCGVRRRIGAAALAATVLAACGGTGAGDDPVTTTMATTSSTTIAPTSSTGTATTTAAPAAGVVVEAADGSARLEIPAGALPAGVDPATITMVVRDVAAAADDPALAALVDDGLATGPAFQLSPAGTEFARPAVLSFEVGAGNGLVTAFLVGDGVVEPLQPAEEQDGDDRVAFLIPHFSAVVTSIGQYEMELAHPDRVSVDTLFPATVTIRPASESAPAYVFTGSIIPSGLVPGAAEFADRTARTGPTSREVEFSCPEPGMAGMRLFGHVVIERDEMAEAWSHLGGFLPRDAQVHWERDIGVQLECISQTEAQAAAAGVYAGDVEFVGIPGAPGSDYLADFVLELDGCGGATLTQSETQPSDGAYFGSLLDTIVFGDIELAGSGSDYAEQYRLSFRLDPETGEIDLEGWSVGGGHGFGEKPTLEDMAKAIGAALAAGPEGEVDGSLIPTDIGWLQYARGRLSHEGDPPGCD